MKFSMPVKHFITMRSIILKDERWCDNLFVFFQIMQPVKRKKFIKVEFEIDMLRDIMSYAIESRVWKCNNCYLYEYCTHDDFKSLYFYLKRIILIWS